MSVAMSVKVLPDRLVNAIKASGQEQEFLDAFKENIPEVEYKYNLVDCYNQGRPANFELSSENDTYIYIDVVDVNTCDIINVAFSKAKMKFFLKEGKFSPAVQLLIHEAVFLLEMFTYDYLYTRNNGNLKGR